MKLPLVLLCALVATPAPAVSRVAQDDAAGAAEDPDAPARELPWVAEGFEVHVRPAFGSLRGGVAPVGTSGSAPPRGWPRGDDARVDTGPWSGLAGALAAARASAEQRSGIPVPDGAGLAVLATREALILSPTAAGPELRLVVEGVDGGLLLASAEELGLPTDETDLEGVVPVAPTAWPDPWGGSLLVALPRSGRVVRLDLVRRGAGFEVAGRADLVRGLGAFTFPGYVNAGVLRLSDEGAGRDALFVTAVDEGPAPEPLPGPDADAATWVRVLERRDPAVRWFARQHLMGATEPPVLSGIDPLAAVQALGDALTGQSRMPDENLPRVLRRARYRSDLDGPVARADAVAVLLRLALDGGEAAPRARILLERCLDHELPDVRAQGARALSRLPGELADPDRLVDLLEDPAPEVRVAVAAALLRHDVGLARPEVLAAWEVEGDRVVRAGLAACLRHLEAWETIAGALARTVDPDRRALLWELLDGAPDRERVLAVGDLLDLAEDYRVRVEALDRLSAWHRVPGPEGELVEWEGSARVRRYLERAHEGDRAPAVREHAARLLERLAPR